MRAACVWALRQLPAADIERRLQRLRDHETDEIVLMEIDRNDVGN